MPLDPGQRATVDEIAKQLGIAADRRRQAQARATFADQQIAFAVSADPTSPAWFARKHAGTVTVDELAEALGWTPERVVAAVERHRKRLASRS